MRMQWAFRAAVLSALLFSAAPILARPEDANSKDASPATPEPARQAARRDKKDEPPKALRDLCNLPNLSSDSWIDRMHRAVYRSVCGSAYWFDSFFGEDNADRERESTFGRLAVGPDWSDHDGFSARGRLKVNLSLPRFEKRINAFLGNYRKDEFAPDRTDTFDSLPALFRDTTDREWLLGLGYRPESGKRRRFDADAGVKLGFPMDPFVRVRGHRHRFLGEFALVRFRQTLFWRGERGLGTTSHMDLERVLGSSYHVRWRNEATIAEGYDGVDWESALTLYHYLGASRALAYEIRFEGETEYKVPLKEYGLRAVYRQSLFRDWFFTELRGGVTWPREEPDETRKASLTLGFSFELLFGDHQ